jgi:hypothetical protein
MEEVSIMKVVPNHLFYLLKFSQVFINFQPIFLAMRIDFRIYLKI